MARLKISPALIIGILIVLFFVISLIFRIYLPYGDIFGTDSIKYANNDSYFYMRLVDNVSSHFPHMTQFDPYYLYPGGVNIVFMPFLHWIIAFLAWVIGLGHPTQQLIDMIGVYLPAIMAALTIIPVFFIGKALFNKWAGVLAAGLMAVFPGEYLSRTILGATDNPIAETLFTTTALAFLIYAVKSASQNQLTFANIWKRDWKVIRKPLICSLFAGIFLGFYLATWQGALIFVAIIAIYSIIQFIINHIRQKSNEYLCIVNFITFLFALIILLLNPYSIDISIAMVLATLLPLVLYGVSKALSYRKLRTFYYPTILVVLAVLAVAVFYFISPGNFHSLFNQLKFVFFPSGASAATTTEMAGALLPQGEFTPVVIWGNFTTSFFIAPWWLIPGLAAAALCGCAVYWNKKGYSNIALFVFFIIATVMLVIITVQQQPSGYSLSDQDVKFIPGLGLIGLSILFYLMVNQGKKQPWYMAVGWVLAILIVLTALMLFTSFQSLRYVALVPLVMLIYILFKYREGDEQLRLFLVWSIIILILPMIQRRFQYYLVINLALLSGYLCWEFIRLTGIEKLTAKAEDAAKKELSFETAAKTPEYQDYYEVLGVAKNASFKVIKSAFRRLAADYHPGPDNPLEEENRFKRLNRAHQTLTNPTQRASYDNSLREITERKKLQSPQKGRNKVWNFVNVVLVIVMVFLFAYFPNIAKSQVQAPTVPYAITTDWQDALLWMKDNTPEPLGDPNAYYQDYDALRAGEEFVYPSSVYAVTAWWDFGYWIMRIAHRIPNTNPSQRAAPIIKVANFFMSEDQATIKSLRKELGSAYIVSDYEVSVIKLPALLKWANQDRNKYLPVYYIAQKNELVQVQLFSLDYYRMLIVRLYNFDCKAVTTVAPTVIVYKMVTTSTGMEVRQIIDAKDFTSYQEAVDYIASQNSTTDFYEIVGTDPYISPIPLDALDDYQVIYNSASSTNSTQPVKIFKYIGND